MCACHASLWVLLWAVPPTALPEDRNALFRFVSICLSMLLAVTAAWPLNIPLAALAYKIQHGAGPTDMDWEDLWWRAGFAALLTCGLSLVALALVYVLIAGAGLPSGLVQLVVLAAYLPAGAWVGFWAFGLEDMLQGLGFFIIYVMLPGLPLWWLGRLVGLWDRVSQSAPWLLPPS